MQNPRMQPDSSSRQITPWIRVFSTVFLLGLVHAAGRILLPGIDAEQLANLLARAQQPEIASSTLSIVALGLTPLMTGFFLVELAAVVIPAWRLLRADGLTGRRKLTRAALGVSMLIAIVQGYFVARWLEGVSIAAAPGLDILVENRPPGWTVLIALTLAGGTAALWAVAGIIDRVGIGSGVAVLVGSSLALELFGDLKKLAQSLTLAPAELGLLLLITFSVAMATWLLLRSSGPGAQSGSARDAAIQQPITTLLPLQSSASALMLPVSLANLGWISSESAAAMAPGTAAYHVTHLALVALLALLCGWVFSRPSRRIDGSPAHRRRALLLSGLYLLGLWGVSTLPPLLQLPPLPSLLYVAMLTAIVVDLQAEWRARKRHPSLIAVWRAPSVEAATAACIDLQRAGIFAMTRGLYLRSLWRFFVPLYAIDILVPEAAAERARLLLSGAAPATAAQPVVDEPAMAAPISRRTIFVVSGALLMALALCVGGMLRVSILKSRPVLRLILSPLQPVAAEALAQDVPVLSARLEKLGIGSARVQVRSAQLIVELPQLEPAMLERVRTTLQRSGRLELLSIDNQSPEMGKITQYVIAHQADFPKIEIGYDAWSGAHGESQTDLYLEAATQGPLDRFLAALPSEYAVPADHKILFEQKAHLDQNGLADGTRRFRSHYLVREPVLTGQSLREVELAEDQMGRPEVALTLNDAGAKRFADFTASHIGKRLAIVLEGVVMSAPTIQSRISGGHVRITLGNANPKTQMQEASDLVAVLRVGELPTLLRIDREEPIE